MEKKVVLSKEALERINVCAKIVALVQKRTARSDEKWNVWTYREDIGNKDPMRFKVHISKKVFMTKFMVPKKHLFDIFFDVDKKNLLVVFEKKNCNISPEGFGDAGWKRYAFLAEEINELLPVDMRGGWDISVETC